MSKHKSLAIAAIAAGAIFTAGSMAGAPRAEARGFFGASHFHHGGYDFGHRFWGGYRPFGFYRPGWSYRHWGYRPWSSYRYSGRQISLPRRPFTPGPCRMIHYRTPYGQLGWTRFCSPLYLRAG